MMSYRLARIITVLLVILALLLLISQLANTVYQSDLQLRATLAERGTAINQTLERLITRTP